jgi:hypothetical protein
MTVRSLTRLRVRNNWARRAFTKREALEKRASGARLEPARDSLQTDHGIRRTD